MHRPCVVIFVKAPCPGQVKTRLAQAVGQTHAVELYRCFGQDVVATVDHLDVDSAIFFTPSEGLEAIKDWLGPERRYCAQQGQTLGDRMAHAFGESFRWGSPATLILGSDSPDLPSAILQQALEGLRSQYTPIGPTEDGGYYTLGFTPTTFCPEVFIDMPWSTAAVYALTHQTLQQQQHSIAVLPRWTDIDTRDDLWRFYQRHGQQVAPPLAGHHTLQYLHTHASTLWH